MEKKISENYSSKWGRCCKTFEILDLLYSKIKHTLQNFLYYNNLNAKFELIWVRNLDDGRKN